MEELSDEQQRTLLALKGAMSVGTGADIRSKHAEAIRRGVSKKDIHAANQEALQQFPGLTRKGVSIVMVMR